MSKSQKQDEYKEYRCCVCGCFMEEIDASTEGGWDYDLVCNNKKCKSKSLVFQQRIEAWRYRSYPPEHKIVGGVMSKSSDKRLAVQINYQDGYGKPISLIDLCRQEPAWAANCIRVLKKTIAKQKAALDEIKEVALHVLSEIKRELKEALKEGK